MNQPLPSSHANVNGDSSQDTNAKRMLDDLNQSNQQLLHTIDNLKANANSFAYFHFEYKIYSEDLTTMLDE